MQLGSAKICITPQAPVRLCGYATRTTCFEGVKEDIFLRVQVHCEGTVEAIYLYADLLWWNTDFVTSARLALEKELGIAAENLFFVASHNHSGPPTGSTFVQQLEQYDAAYAQFLLQQVRRGILTARSNMEPVTMAHYSGTCCLNVFRRVAHEGVIAMQPNYDVPADRHLTVLRFCTQDGSTKGMLIHYPCHANLSNENFIQPDYPGVALRLLDEEFGGISLFLQGCTGDLRPNSTLGEKFTPVDYAKVVVFADYFVQACKQTLQSQPKQITGALRLTRTGASLPLEGVQSKQALEAMTHSESEIERQWAQKVLEKGNADFETLEVSRIAYGEEFSVFTLNGEVSQAYAAFVRNLQADAVCAGYTNGMIGYLSTALQIAQGGYEPKGSAQYFALAGTYVADIENIIHRALACV